METWAAVRDEEIGLADQLEHLEANQWDSPSLCTEWRIRDVLAHVTAGAEGAFRTSSVISGTLRYGLNYNRWVAADGRARGQRDPKTILRALRNAAASRATSHSGSLAGLAHVVVHGQDMCRPLGVKRELSEEHLTAVADFVSTSIIFRAKKRIAGLKLTAIDMDWSAGHGPEVTGPGEALVMVMAGRLAALDDLSGQGKATLAGRW